MTSNSVFNLFLFAKFDMPVETSITILIFSAAIAIFSLIGVFASDGKLQSWASIIGTDKPRVARAMCVLGVIVGCIGTASAVAGLMGFIK